MTRALAAIVHQGDPAAVESAARDLLGTNSLAHNALNLVAKGETTIAEAMAVVASADF